MTAKFVTFFIWGGLVSAAWWQASMFGHAEFSRLWIIPVMVSIISLTAWVIIFSDRWNDK